MNKKFSIRSNELIGAKLVLEVLEENAKLIYRKGDVIRCTGIFKKENICAKKDTWELDEDETWVNSGEGETYIEHSGKLYRRAFIIVKLTNDLDKIYFDNNEEAYGCYEEIVQNFGLNPVY